jgi:hypothetical protein
MKTREEVDLDRDQGITKKISKGLNRQRNQNQHTLPKMIETLMTSGKTTVSHIQAESTTIMTIDRGPSQPLIGTMEAPKIILKRRVLSLPLTGTEIEEIELLRYSTSSSKNVRFPINNN